MRRYFLEVSYNGIAFHGSQIQKELNTVQLSVNQCLSTILRTPIETFGASRTDEGVHALCNVYHFDFDGVLGQNTLYKLNAIGSSAMSYNALYEVPLDANARFDAISRTYRYRIYQKKNPFKFQRALFHPYPLAIDQLQMTANVLKEYTDFTTFSKKNTQSFTNNCTIFTSYWEMQQDEIHYVVQANRFLRGMVRALVGTQLKMCKLQKNEAEFRALIEAKDCSLADFSVTGNGLYLEHIQYPSYQL